MVSPIFDNGGAGLIKAIFLSLGRFGSVCGFTMQLTKRHILCVDAHEDICFMLSTLLQGSDYKITTTRRIDHALEHARNERFDLFIIGRWFLDGTGLELCQKIREFDSGTPIIFYSADANEADRQEALGAGAQAYLIEGGDISEIVETVNRFLSPGK